VFVLIGFLNVNSINKSGKPPRYIGDVLAGNATSAPAVASGGSGTVVAEPAGQLRSNRASSNPVPAAAQLSPLDVTPLATSTPRTPPPANATTGLPPPRPGFHYGKPAPALPPKPVQRHQAPTRWGLLMFGLYILSHFCIIICFEPYV